MSIASSALMQNGNTREKGKKSDKIQVNFKCKILADSAQHRILDQAEGKFGNDDIRKILIEPAPRRFCTEHMDWMNRKRAQSLLWERYFDKGFFSTNTWLLFTHKPSISVENTIYLYNWIMTVHALTRSQARRSTSINEWEQLKAIVLCCDC